MNSIVDSEIKQRKVNEKELFFGEMAGKIERAFVQTQIM